MTFVCMQAGSGSIKSNAACQPSQELSQMNRSIFQQHIEFQHGVSALNADDIPTEALTLGEEEESEAVAPAKRSRRFRQADFNPDWHDAKEIVVPFDESSFSGLLVDEKTFQAAYSPKRPPPQAGNLRLETKQTLGKVMSSPDWWDDLMGFCGGLLLFVEILLLVWTAALLLSGFPFSK